MKITHSAVRPYQCMEYMHLRYTHLRYSHLRYSHLRLFATCIIGVLTMGCHSITDTQLPDGVESPATYNNPDGATRLTKATLNELAKTIANYVMVSGLLTDELEGNNDVNFVLTGNPDMRSGVRAGDPPHTVRALARLTRGVVNKYVPGATDSWKARLLLYEAYAEILTADGWCPGVPLSTLDFEGDWTYRPGSTTDEIYAHAIQLLDSADALASDSASVRAAIRVLMGRAYLSRGQYPEAKQVVTGIDPGFQYTLRIAFDNGRRNHNSFVAYADFITKASISDLEGINGLPYRSSDDPRTGATLISGQSGQRQPSWFPLKYVTQDSSTFTLASGVEAQLILAEVALHDNDSQQMLARLNALRTTGAYTIEVTSTPDGGETNDTVWAAGLGGVAGLRSLIDPGTPDGRRQLLFAERAAWLFLTGNRQGDLRRLIRTYGLDREQVYPTGEYVRTGYTNVYGSDIWFWLSDAEYRNPLFTGCRDHE